ncbi:hypothetical protein PPL_01907 [Heterostelium album PN500]|uniref:Uncharacterized protein n=1 Tax=Heterostelium pallidum (strain ATCC 26659 / Pp 5 / PN500) TaxID=670386 RepID=D3B0U0_HETP5|nr:hypothetical protein PPL_01907 [Heterostelium album PN500]EFA84914.1 hypothetical protein PPL_01907 [Heterostelium album PN500]|eukprot:XP_020437024.1 hypothetical protein PPL_01907 [Heterostelium album PN500]
MNPNQYSFCRFKKNSLLILSDTEYYQSIQKESQNDIHENDILYQTVKFLYLYDESYNQKSIRDQLSPNVLELKSILCDFIKNHRLSLPNFSFINVFMNNKDLFEDDQLMNYLKSLCNQSDIADLFVISLLQSDQIYFHNLSSRMSKFNSWFNIESRVIDLINNNTIRIHSLPIAILSILNINPTRISELSKYYKDIFQYLMSDFTKDTWNCDFNSYSQYFGYFKEYFDSDINLQTPENIERLKSKLKCFGHDFIVGARVKKSFRSIYALFSVFIKSEFELFTLVSGWIEVQSATKMFESFDNDMLRTPEFNTSIKKMLTQNQEESLLILDLYRTRSLKLPLEIYDHFLLVFVYNPQYDDRILANPLTLISLIYLLSIESNVSLKCLIVKIMLKSFHLLEKQLVISVFKSQQHLFSLTDFKFQMKNHPDYFKLVAPHIELYTMKMIINHPGHNELLSADFADIILLTSHSREIIKELVSMKERNLRTPFSLLPANVERNTHFLLEINNLEFIYLYLEQLFCDLAALSPERNSILVQLIERLVQNKPEYAIKINHILRSAPLSNFLNRFIEFKRYLSLQPDHNNTNSTIETTTITPPPTLSKFILNEIFKNLILDKNPKSRSIISLSTISSGIHDIISSIVSNYPLTTIRIISSVPIGSKYCLLKNAPLYLTSREIKFIPDDHLQSCIENLESYVQYFGFINAKGKGCYSYLYYLLNAKKIKHLAFREVKSIPYDSEYFDSGFLNESMISDHSNSLYNLRECRDYYPDEESNRNIILDDEEKQIHYMNVFLQHFDNDQLQSISYEGRSFKSNNYHSDTNSLVHHTLSIFSTFKSKKSWIDLKFNVPKGVAPCLGFIKHEESDAYSEREPIILHEDYQLITKFKWGRYSYHYDLLPIELKNLTKLVTICDEQEGLCLIQSSPKLYYVKIQDCRSVDDLSFIENQPKIKKLAIKYPVKIKSENNIYHFRTRITLDQINSIFSRLEQAEYQSIRYDEHQHHYPLINQYQIDRNLINLYQFKPCGNSVTVDGNSKIYNGATPTSAGRNMNVWITTNQRFS